MQTFILVVVGMFGIAEVLLLLFFFVGAIVYGLRSVPEKGAELISGTYSWNLMQMKIRARKFAACSAIFAGAFVITLMLFLILL